jgi:hypothetical protein
MTFFDKMKKGVHGAGAKAKTMVEVNRLKMQISQKEKEVIELYARIGELVFSAVQKNDYPAAEPAVKTHCQDIIEKREEIAKIYLALKEINNEKECTCGRTVAIDVKFCPACGAKFEDAQTDSQQS